MAGSDAAPGKLAGDRGHQLTMLRECGEGGEVEAVGGEEECQEGQQQADAADHGVDQKLRSGAGAARTSPQLDEEEGGDEAELPEEEEVEEIERGKSSEETGLEEQDQREVKLHAVGDMPGCEDADRHHDGGEQEHEEPQAVDSHVVFGAECCDPEVALLKLDGSRGGVEVGPQN
jgi:hypothetical protein